MSDKIGQFRRVLRSCVGGVVGYDMRQGFGAAIAPLLEQVMRGDRVHDRDIYAAFASDDSDFERRDKIAAALATPLVIPAGRGGKATALVSVRGIATYDLEYAPLCFSTLLLAQTVTALANDPEIGTVILDIDSPGGVVTGTQEAADAIFAARKGANIVAMVNPLSASAAYWIASQAQEIVAVPSADIGSVGVFMMHTDCSKMMEEAGVKPTFIFAKDSPYKVEGNMYEPLGEEAKAYYQSEVDVIMAMFVKSIARGRGVPSSKVLSDFGQGRTMSAPDAKAAGMIDRVATINQAMARWGISQATLENRRRGEDVKPEPAAKDADESIESVVIAADEIVDVAAVQAAMKSTITYAKAGGPPDNWREITVLNVETGEEVVDIVEVNATEGWAVINAISENGHRIVFNGTAVTKRIEGKFRIIPKSELPEGTPVADHTGMFTQEIQNHKNAQRRRQIKLHRWS